MNIYQHLFILIPALAMLGYGVSGQETFWKLFSTFLGIVIFLMYPIIFLAFFVLNVFRYLGTL